MTIKLIYIAGPYRAPNAWETEQNIRRVEVIGIQVAKLGAYPVMPHTNTRYYFESFGTAKLWLGGTLELLKRCDAALFAPGWQASSGARAEREWCEQNGFLVFDGLHTLEAWLRKP